MKASCEAVGGRLTFQGISKARRHVYFYLLLALTTVLAHRLWTTIEPLATLPGASEPAAQLSRVRQASVTPASFSP